MAQTTCLAVDVISVSGYCKNIGAVKAGKSIDHALLNCWPAYLVLCLIIAIMLSWIFVNQYALSNLLLLDIYDRIADGSTNIKQRAKFPIAEYYMDLGKG